MIGLFLLSFPAGFMIVFVDRPTIARSDYTMILIISGIAFSIVFGGICLIIYAILKDKKFADPSRISLNVYTVFLFLFFINSFRMNDALKKRDHYEFMSGMKDELYKVFTEKINAMPDAPPELKNHVDEICTCIYYKLKSDEDLVDELILDKDPQMFAAHNPKMKKIAADCFGIYMK